MSTIKTKATTVTTVEQLKQKADKGFTCVLTAGVFGRGNPTLLAAYKGRFMFTGVPRNTADPVTLVKRTCNSLFGIMCDPAMAEWVQKDVEEKKLNILSFEDEEAVDFLGQMLVVEADADIIMHIPEASVAVILEGKKDA